MSVNTEIIAAAKLGDIPQVRDLLRNGANLHTTTGDGPYKRTLLHHAASFGSADLVEFLITAGIPVDVEDSSGKTALYYAVENEKLEACRALILHKATINLKGDWNPLGRAAAVTFNGTHILQLLLDSGGDIKLAYGGTSHIALFDALLQQNVEATELLINWGSDINFKDANGYTPLNHVSYHNRPEHLKLLLDHGATVSTKSKYGDTPLHNAASGGQAAMVQILLDNGAELNATNNKNETPLYAAVDANRPYAVEALLRAGADRYIKTSEGKTALSLTSELKKPQKILQLFSDIPESSDTEKEGLWNKLMKSLGI